MKTFVIKIIANSDEKDPELLHWRKGKRCLLKVSDDFFVIGKEMLSFTEVQCVDLIIIPSALFISNIVLTLQLKSGVIHHMKSTDDPFWRREFPFPLTVTRGGASFLLIRRVGVIAMVLWLLWILLFLK